MRHNLRYAQRAELRKKHSQQVTAFISTCKAKVIVKNLMLMLWTFRDRSFIPHEISPVPIENCPVTISAEKSPDMTSGHSDMLLNVSLELPENFKQFQRIAEIIDTLPESVHAGRERYRFLS